MRQIGQGVPELISDKHTGTQTEITTLLYKTSLGTHSCPEMEFNEFEPRFKSAKTRFKLSAGLNLETSVSDPYHFDLDPDPEIRIRDDGSGSEITVDSVNRIFPIKCYARL